MPDHLTTADHIDIAFVEADAAARDTRMALDAAFSAVIEAQPRVLNEKFLDESLAAIRSIEQSLSWLHNEVCGNGEAAIREACADDGYKMVGSLLILADELNQHCTDRHFDWNAPSLDEDEEPLTEDDIVLPKCAPGSEGIWCHLNGLD